ncbi:F-box/kelch-repeat protein At3g23880-like [Syzygium oleosum]|uniref:F-box/kelch-repeat protein At3g23880-like n=1 Tax=Syzygium oleosum TaxID=219896 RepID=UPI0011D1E908|nr:F-box/kelch-repeat protein At3g23880-like [Syzygium oleosum]
MRLEKNLPHEIDLEILKRLPVKPLMRFKCISKLWLCTIDDPDFVAMQLKQSTLNGTNWYVLLMDWNFSRHPMSSLYPDKSITVASQSEVEVPFISPMGNYRVVGSCNGLTCVTYANPEDGNLMIFMWNLFTRKYKAVQSSPLDFVDTHMVLGFGYSDKINDYKVIRITYFHDKYRGYLGRLEREVDSLRTDLWRTVEFDIGCEFSDLSTVSLNGNLNWILINVDEGHCWCYGSIITFELAYEVFNKMALPKSYLVGVTYHRAYLAVLNSSLVLLIHHVDPRGQLNDKCYIWIMTEYGVPESWTKLHTLDLNEGVSRFHGFTRSSELLMEMYQHELISWNPSVGLTRLLWTLGAFDLVTVVESLVTP